jgi:hypothetical protein
MRVALCLFGHFRTFDSCFPNLKSNLLDRYNVDVFGAAWTDNTGAFIQPENSENPRNHAGFDTSTLPVDDDYISAVKDKLKPINLHLDQYYKHDLKFQEIVDTVYSKKPHSYVPHRPKGTLSLNYIKWMSIKIKKDYEIKNNFVYDRVICTRWDINHVRPVELEKYDSNALTINDRYNPVPDDLWGCGSSAVLDIWGDQYNGLYEVENLPEFYIAPHEWMKTWLEYKNVILSFKRLPIDICR